MAMRKYLLQRQPPCIVLAHCSPLLMAEWLSRASLSKEIRSTLQVCGLLPEHYFTLSFRTCAATTAAAAGRVLAWLIKVLCHWSSDCYERYIRTTQAVLLVIPKNMTLGNSRAVI